MLGAMLFGHMESLLKRETGSDNAAFFLRAAHVIGAHRSVLSH